MAIIGMGHTPIFMADITGNKISNNNSLLVYEKYGLEKAGHEICPAFFCKASLNTRPVIYQPCQVSVFSAI